MISECAAVLPISAPEPIAPVAATVEFAEGLFGFPQCRDFTLSATARPGFYWLRSLEHEPLAFLLADPFIFFADYSVELSDADVSSLAPDDSSNLAVLAIVTLPRTGGEPLTANLQGPIALNLTRGVARQVILTDTRFGLRCPFRVDAADAA